VVFALISGCGIYRIWQRSFICIDFRVWYIITVYIWQRSFMCVDFRVWYMAKIVYLYWFQGVAYGKDRLSVLISGCGIWKRSFICIDFRVWYMAKIIYLHWFQGVVSALISGCGICIDFRVWYMAKIVPSPCRGGRGTTQAIKCQTYTARQAETFTQLLSRVNENLSEEGSGGLIDKS